MTEDSGVNRDPEIISRLLINEAGRERPFVLFHGLGQNTTALQAVTDELTAHDHPVLLERIPGHGQIQFDATTHGTLELLAAHTRERVATELGSATNPYLGGHSMGGYVVTEMANQNPDYQGLLLMHSAHIGPLVIAPHTAEMMQGAVEESRRIHEDSGERIVNYSFPAQKPDDMTFGTKVGPALAHPDAFEAYVGAVGNYRLGDHSRLVMPVVLIGGEGDMPVPASVVREFGETLPRAQVHIHRGGHNAIFQEPKLVLEGIRDKYEFLTSKG